MTAQPATSLAVVTAYRPGPGLAAVVASVVDQVDVVVVVDNTPPGDTDARAHVEPSERVEILPMGYNSGLAAALNAGVARHPGADRVLLLDQDSTIPPDLVARLGARLDADPTIGVVGPAPWDADAGRYLDPRSAARPELADLGAIITSGMLVRRATLDAVGPFREDFFVDCVDQEFCLRVRAARWRVCQDRTVLLPHGLGETRWHGWGPLRLRATHHPTWRLYWIGRNSAIMLREHATAAPGWSVQWLAIVAYWGLTILLFEPPRLERAATLVRGLLHGVARRPVPARYRPAGPPNPA
ncbi:glycosyltransferase [Cellulomonas sp. H30R-01]|uniref:glycosyltransferase n=1 Tax=Cellulomonas sp. H30R-01 TaxID=2704467 RepID=UPI00138C3272|nr:glycosyltransferase [Cellulomonas sp. H30R-01]QHT56319.1 glycosyltransferase [Cellulomonas sp. H30R-01]